MLESSIRLPNDDQFESHVSVASGATLTFNANWNAFRFSVASRGHQTAAANPCFDATRTSNFIVCICTFWALEGVSWLKGNRPFIE